MCKFILNISGNTNFVNYGLTKGIIAFKNHAFSFPERKAQTFVKVIKNSFIAFFKKENNKKLQNKE